ncbi:hypothetical protein ACLB1T_28845 [Escherichia coli]
MVIIGPCSIHDLTAATEYATVCSRCATSTSYGWN